MGVFPKVNEIYSAYFEKDKYPARACFAVAALPKNAKI
jgi:enamine deaminase RidA (YjgF/YER057c/UK114 family)